LTHQPEKVTGSIVRQVLSSRPERCMCRYLRQFVPGLEFSTATR